MMKIILLAFVLLAFTSSLFAQNATITWKSETADTVKNQKEDMWWAKSIQGQKFSFIVEDWVSEKPDMTDKFILVDFWTTWCAPCRKLIPHMNELSKKFKEKFVFVAFSDESVAEVKAMKEPVIEYYSAVDTKRRLHKDILDLKTAGHALVVDPDGIVCWEGDPGKITEELLDNLVKRFELVKNFKAAFKFEPMDSEEKEIKRREMWWAKSVLGQRFPLIVEDWVSEKPDTTGKFKVVEFWGTWCGPCKKSIPHLNDLSEKFKEDFVFIGVSDETVAQVKSMKEPVIKYYSAVDSKNRLRRGVLDLKSVPYAVVVNPDGIVCWEGEPNKLSEEIVKGLIKDFKLTKKHK